MRINQRTSYRFDPELWFGAVVVLAVIGFFIFGIVNSLHTSTHAGCHVTDKDRTSHSDGDGGNKSDARIYTDNCGVFKVADSWLSWTFHSADTYSSIQVGKTYDFKTRGYRVPFFSGFPNIVEATEVNDQ